jgi:hypothetical protein
VNTAVKFDLLYILLYSPGVFWLHDRKSFGEWAEMGIRRYNWARIVTKCCEDGIGTCFQLFAGCMFAPRFADHV